MPDLRKDTELFCREYGRMCRSFVGCTECPCKGINPCAPVDNPERAAEIIAAVQAWSDEHPQKTYVEDLIGKFPKLRFGEDGYPAFCRTMLYGDMPDCINMRCEDCWNQPIE